MQVSAPVCAEPLSVTHTALKADFGASVVHDRVPSTTATSLEAPYCDTQFGGTKGCDCMGRAVDVNTYGFKVPPPGERAQAGLTDAQIKKVACSLNNTMANFQSIYSNQIESSDVKWLYYGSQEGVLANFPNFLWPGGDQSTASKLYDPRLRPWMMTAATGPKNVVFILDKSGSMAQQGRIQALRTTFSAVIDGEIALSLPPDCFF